ncbi:hypothetical protein E4U60_006864 [Claviceps pazoutovae]|uniref:Uncharacterized protein n=1 Tax=Claviceps pazoutovae TaxID=1649127 RepID=A0A9P7MKH0_9HYPO|nr:hypothetical protein E4U60_006864 [Claviceps pazoutovae]
MSFSNGGGTLALPSPTHAHHMDVTSANQLPDVRTITTSFTPVTVSAVRGNSTKAAHCTVATTNSASGSLVGARNLLSPIVHLDTPSTEPSTVSAFHKVGQNVNELVAPLDAHEGFIQESFKTSPEYNSRSRPSGPRRRRNFSDFNCSSGRGKHLIALLFTHFRGNRRRAG